MAQTTKYNNITVNHASFQKKKHGKINNDCEKPSHYGIMNDMTSPEY